MKTLLIMGSDQVTQIMIFFKLIEYRVAMFGSVKSKDTQQQESAGRPLHHENLTIKHN